MDGRLLSFAQGLALVPALDAWFGTVWLEAGNEDGSKTAAGKAQDEPGAHSPAGRDRHEKPRK